MIISRLQRGGLAEAMETAKTFDTIDEMKQWYVDEHDNAFSCDDVVIKEDVMYDHRNGWNTRYVCVKKYGSEDFIAKYGAPQCIGMCDLDYKG